MTLGLIVELNNLLHAKGVTQERVREMLNKHLPPKKQIQGHTGTVTLSRWLNPTSEAWSEPRAEIILAMQKVVKDLSK